MWLQRWDPFRELDQMQERMGRFLEDGAVSARNFASSVGSTDVYEEGNNVVVEVALPRFDKDDVELNAHQNRLEIKAVHKDETERKDRSYLRRESSLQSFFRVVALPQGANTDSIKADFDNGVLKVTVPMMELPLPKRVEIDGGKKKNDK